MSVILHRFLLSMVPMSKRANGLSHKFLLQQQKGWKSQKARLSFSLRFIMVSFCCKRNCEKYPEKYRKRSLIALIDTFEENRLL